MMPEEQKPYEIVPIRKKKLSEPQTKIMRLLNDGATLKNSTYFYGFEMKLKNGDRIYFRRDTINSMIRKKLIKQVVHICGTYLEVDTDCDC